MGIGVEPAAPAGRMLAIDERGIGLRATWRLDYGFINLSIWRNDACVETFHLTPNDAARFVSFLVNGLADVATVRRAGAPLRAVPESPVPTPMKGRRDFEWARSQVAGALRQLADRIAPR